MTRDNLIQLMAKAHLSYGRHPALRSPVPMQGDIDAMSDALAAIEAAGVRLVPVEMSDTQLHHAMYADHPEGRRTVETVLKAQYRSAVAASPYAKDNGNG